MDVILNRRRPPPPRRRMTRSHRFHQPRHSHLIITTRAHDGDDDDDDDSGGSQTGRRSRSVTRSNGHECGQSGYPSICTSLMQGERGRVVGVRGKGRRLILSFLCSSHFLPHSNTGGERGFHSGITNKRAGEQGWVEPKCAFGSLGGSRIGGYGRWGEIMDRLGE